MESFNELKKIHAMKVEKLSIATEKIKEVYEMLPVLLPYTIFRYVLKQDGNICEFIEWNPDNNTLNAVIGTRKFTYLNDWWPATGSPQRFRVAEDWDHIFHIIKESASNIDTKRVINFTPFSDTSVPSELNAYKD